MAKDVVMPLLGLTMEDIAKSVGCTRPIVSMWESGKSSPTGHFLVLLGEVLRTHPREFYELQEVQEEFLFQEGGHHGR